MLTRAQKLKAEIELIDHAIETGTPLPRLLSALRKDYILRAAEIHNGDVMATAVALAVDPRQVSSILRREHELMLRETK